MASDLGKSWSGHSTFRPMRHADDIEEDDGDLDDDMQRMAAAGLYGFTKALQRDVDASVGKLKRFASKTAHAIWSKDPKTAEFLSTHARRADSLPAKALLSAMADLGPKVDRMAAGRTHGLYGFRNKTAKEALIACQAMREESGHIAHDLYTRRLAKYADIMAYLEKHCDATQCPYAAMLKTAMPEEKFSLMRLAQDRDSGAGSSSEFFFSDPRKREVREFAQSQAPTNVPTVLPKIVKEYENLDQTPSKMRSEVKESPNTPSETIKVTPGSDQFSTLSRYIVFTEQPVKKMPSKVPEGREDIAKAPEMSIIHDLVSQRIMSDGHSPVSNGRNHVQYSPNGNGPKR